MQTLDHTITLKLETCCCCGIVFGIESRHIHHLRQSHEWFYCPSGHRQRYVGETDAQKAERLAKGLDEMRRRADYQKELRLQAQRSLAATKGHVTRLRRKITAGQCPACTERFPDLASHMSEAHPEYAHEAEGITDD